MGHDAWADQDFVGTQGIDRDQRIRSELAPGENVVWRGQPRPGRTFLLSLPIGLFGMVFAGFAVFWITQASRMPDAGIFPLFGLPFLVVGGAMMLSPLWFFGKARQTRYAITDRRAIVIEPQLGFGVQVRSYEPDALTKIIRNRRDDGSGDLIFEEFQTHNHQGQSRTTRRGFMAIDDVRGVETLLRSTLLDG